MDVPTFSTQLKVDSSVFLIDCIWELFVLVGTRARGSRQDIRLALSSAKVHTGFSIVSVLGSTARRIFLCGTQSTVHSRHPSISSFYRRDFHWTYANISGVSMKNIWCVERALLSWALIDVVLRRTGGLHLTIWIYWWCQKRCPMWVERILCFHANFIDPPIRSLKRQDGRRGALKTLPCSLWELIPVICHTPDTMHISDIRDE